MCMKEDNPYSNYFKGDNYLCGTGNPLAMCLTVVVHLEFSSTVRLISIITFIFYHIIFIPFFPIGQKAGIFDY